MRDHSNNFTFNLKAHCTDFIAKDKWPTNSPDLNPLNYFVSGEILQSIPELKSALQQIWDGMPYRLSK